MVGISVVCAECGASLSRHGDGPCPDCGSDERKINAHAQLGVGVESSARGEKELGTTGRAAEVFNTEEKPPLDHINEFADWLSDEAADREWDEVLTSSGRAQALVEEMEEMMSCGLQGSLWRGRRFRPGEEPADIDELGPPPAEKAQVGRFNEEGDSVLYCTRVQRVVPDEVPATEEKPDLWIQRFDVEEPELGVLRVDTDLEEKHPLLHNLLFLAEQRAKEEEFYRLTHFVREVCRRTGAVAVEYPSVAGGYDEDPEALNIAVFDEGIEAVVASAVGEPEQMEG